MQSLKTRGWQSPIGELLRSGSRAGGALQKGLESLASGTTGLRPFYPPAWLKLAADVLEAIERPACFSPALPALQRSEPPAPRPEVVQAAIDQDVNFHMFSVPDESSAVSPIAGPGAATAENIIGFRIDDALHRFRVTGSAPTNYAPLAAANTLGERVGSCTGLWLFVPDGFHPVPGSQPPPTTMTLDTPQRLMIIDSFFRFGDGADGFRASGVGQTLPVTIRGRKQLRVTAAGTLSDGFGKFRNREDGLFIYCGVLDPATGFLGGITLRVADRQSTLRTSESLQPLQVRHNPEPGITWVTIRAQAIASTAVTSFTAEQGRPGVAFQEEARLVDIDLTVGGPRGLQCAEGVRQPVGTVTTQVTFDSAFVGETLNDPFPFTTRREFSFVDSLKNPIGGFTAESLESFAFTTSVAGVKGVRFAGVSRILTGTGRFAAMSGVLAENTFMVPEPFAGTSTYTLRIDDPTGRFFSRDGVWRDIPAGEVTEHTS